MPRPTLLLALALLAPSVPAQEGTPNVVLILADDLGWGDVRANNPGSSIPTPHFDRLAAEGLLFTDAHSPSGVCTPTRYGVLTGRYCWRSRLKSGVLGGYSTPLLDPGQPTLGTLFQDAGYATAAVGKWHLGMALPLLSDDVQTTPWAGDPGIDFAGTISDGPTHHGFDRYFGVTASLDMAPYVYVRDDHFEALPTAQQPGQRFPDFVRQGPRSIDFRLENVLDDLAREAVSFIEEAAAGEAPFFLYMPLTAPHKPTTPHPHFVGRTELGPYGDFIHQTDWTLGRVLRALDETGAAANTLVVVTSDNGSYMYTRDQRPDHVEDEGVQAFRPEHHRANGPWRGTKADVYEAGHRVPFVVRWPGRVAAGTRSAEPICHVDLYATFAAAAGLEVVEGAAEDSHDLSSLLEGAAGATRGGPVVHHSGNGTFALRDGRWKAIFCTGSGGREQPKGRPFDGVRLFDMHLDGGETRDLAAEQPEIVERMTAALTELYGGPLPDNRPRAEGAGD